MQVIRCGRKVQLCVWAEGQTKSATLTESHVNLWLTLYRSLYPFSLEDRAIWVWIKTSWLFSTNLRTHFWNWKSYFSLNIFLLKMSILKILEQFSQFINYFKLFSIRRVRPADFNVKYFIVLWKVNVDTIIMLKTDSHVKEIISCLKCLFQCLKNQVLLKNASDGIYKCG